MSIPHKLLALAIAVSAIFAATNGAGAEPSAEAAALFNQAIPYMEQENWDMSTRLLYRASQLSPNDFSIQYNLGVAFMGLKRYRESWQAFARASQIKPTSVTAQLGLANAYAECGDKKTCIAILQNCQKRYSLTADQQASVAAMLDEFGDGASQSQSIAQMASKQPGNVDMHKILANSLVKSGKYKEALAEFQTICKMEPDSSHTYQNVMYCQTKLGDLEGLQTTRKLFVQRFPTSKDAQTIRDEIAYYEKDFARTRKREANAAATGERAAFADIRMPVKVYVHNRLSGRTTWSATQAQNAKGKVNYSLMVERALDAWCAASRRKLTFIIIDNPQAANIECQWTADRAQLHYAFASGVTSYSSNQNGEPKATIFLLTDCKDENEFLETSMHEIGHAIGLSHSSSPKDVMYSSGQTLPNNVAPSLSAGDIARLGSLYK